METGSWEKDDKTRATMIRNPTGYELTIDESGGAKKFFAIRIAYPNVLRGPFFKQ